MWVRDASVYALSLTAMLVAVPSIAYAQAVSAPNGKLELSVGALEAPSFDFTGRAAATFTVPIGHDFGFQGDFVFTAPDRSWAAAAHVFTRDPASGLFGGTIGAVRTPGAWVIAAGPEAELYLGQWSIEGWAGFAFAKPDGDAGRLGAFGRVDAAFYPIDDWRLSVGASLLDSRVALHLGTEYLMHYETLPVALTGNLKVGTDGDITVLAGMRVYFGDEDKSLIRRHREDDPVDRGTSLYLSVADYGRTKPAKNIGSSDEEEPDAAPGHDCSIHLGEEWDGEKCVISP